MVKLIQLDWEGTRVYINPDNITCLRDGQPGCAIHFICGHGFPGCPMVVEQSIDEVIARIHDAT
jgi:uncharacterized protein YlzI (FlbEa/FlbD family)